MSSIVRRSFSTSSALLRNNSSKLRFLPHAISSRPGLALLAGSSIAGIASIAVYDKRPSFALGNYFSTTNSSNRMSDFPVQKSDEEWRLQLSAEQFRVLRKQGTEAPGSGEYDKQYPKQGVFNCAGCDAPLYTYDSKFKSGCGWPAFFDNIDGAVKRNVDRTFGMERTEIVCANCGGHLGHVFKGEKFGHPKDERHCVNSVSIKYAPDAEK